MVEQEGVIARIELLLGDQTHRTIEIEGFKVKTDVKRKAKGFSVEKTYGLEESRRYELDRQGNIKEILLFENVALELVRMRPDEADYEALERVLKEAEEHATREV